MLICSKITVDKRTLLTWFNNIFLFFYLRHWRNFTVWKQYGTIWWSTVENQILFDSFSKIVMLNSLSYHRQNAFVRFVPYILLLYVHKLFSFLLTYDLYYGFHFTLFSILYSHFFTIVNIYFWKTEKANGIRNPRVL